MSNTRQRDNPLRLDLSNDTDEELPAVVAVFLVLFDVKAGMEKIRFRVYVIPATSKTTINDALVELNDSVEYKSLPSGLHNVREDLIYFIHDEEYVGISAFVNKPAEESDRNALMLAVGALVMSTARLGKSWRHAIGLKELAKKLSKDSTKTDLLEDFWSKHQQHDERTAQDHPMQPGTPSAAKSKRRQSQTSPNGQRYSRKRAVTAASAIAPPGQSLSPHHPALSLSTFLETFGPLIFPLYKAALLRKRVLLVGHAPVELACNYVYDISILSGIPSSVSELIPLEPLPSRLRPLFSVGVHDMQTLAQGSRNQSQNSNVLDEGMGYGWVANTTDDILSLKDRLYDILITIPPLYSKDSKEKVWPKIEAKRGTQIKATQRDLRRYRTLCNGLRRCYSSRSYHASSPSSRNDPTPDSPVVSTQATYDEASLAFDAQLAEPQSWSAIAYDNFIWWASAGEQRTDLNEEEEYDAALMRQPDPYNDDLSPTRPKSARKSPGRSPGMEAMDTQPAGLEVTIIAYFHRLTTLILKTLAEIVVASDYSDADSDANGDENGQTDAEDTPLAKGKDAASVNADTVFVNSEDMGRMALDIWSESDREFVRELVAFYWGRKAEVRGGRIECCGVRIC